MSQKQQNIPALRFPEFENTWEKFKLSQIADINPKSKELPDSFIYIDLESVNSGTLTKETRILKSEAPSRAQRLLNKEDILYQTVRPYQKNNYFFNKHNSEYVASTGYAQIRTVNNSAYLYHYLHTNYFVKKVLLRCTGTSYPAISSSDLAKIKMFIPKLSEQQKIATFLTSVDKRIKALEHKKELLEQYKKGVMQKIFSREIRFQPGTVTHHLPLAAEPTTEYNCKNAYPDWESKPLRDVFKSERGKGLSKDKVIQNGQYDCILYGELYTHYSEVIENIKSKTNTNEGLASKSGDLLIPSSTTTTGIDLANVTALYKSNVLLGGDITVLRAKSQVNNTFFAYYLSNHKKRELSSFAQGITIVHLSYNNFKDMEIEVPSLEEQKKIAGFLSAIDTKIEAVTSQIDHSKTYKKGLLQKMFV